MTCADQLAAARAENQKLRSALYQAAAFLKTGGSAAGERAAAAIARGLAP